jgi:hypothetical protein
MAGAFMACLLSLLISGHENRDESDQEDHDPPGYRQHNGNIGNDALNRVNRLAVVLQFGVGHDESLKNDKDDSLHF